MADPFFGAPVTNPFGLTDVGSIAAPTFADIDGDGDLDAFVGAYDGNTRFFRNSGSAAAPSFVNEASNFGLTDVGSLARPALADIDGDGDLDAFVGRSDGNTLFFRNSGSATAPSFVAEASNFGLTDVGDDASPTFADIDGDGDLDAFVGSYYGDTLFFRNSGSAAAPTFVSEAGNFGLTAVGYFASPTFADIDGDGDLDAFVGGYSGITLFFRNGGSATAPSFAHEANNFGLTDVGAVASPTFADIDADGDLDAFVGGADGITRFFINTVGVTITPSGGGTAVTEGGASDSYTVVLTRQPTADVVITLDTTNHQVSANVTSLTFTAANWNVAQTVTVTAVDDAVGEGRHTGVIRHGVASADAHYNGFAADAVRIAVTDDDLPQGDPSFGAPVTNPFGLTDVGSHAHPTLADIDGDGDLDAFVGANDGDTRFFRNSGSAAAPSFVLEGNNFGLTDVGNVASPTFADIDGDGDLDAFVGELTGNTLFFRNSGSAAAPSFGAPVTNPFGLTDVGGHVHPTFADIDGDGDLDAFVGGQDGITLFFRNSGSAAAPSFVLEGNNFGLTDVGYRASPTFADIDGDGDLDAFVGANDGDTRFFRNSGSAAAPSFVLEGNNFGLTDVGYVASPTFADIDGDGDLDAFVGEFIGVTRFFINKALDVTITPSGGGTAVTEGGATDSYTVVLKRQPTADVVITLDTTNHQVSANVTSLTFTAANWNVAQTVTVTAVDDAVGEGRHTGVIRHGVASADAHYNGFAADAVRIAVTDDDLPQVDPVFGAPVTNPFGLTDVGQVATSAFADIDGDGDLDAFVGAQDGDTRFFRNSGSAAAPSFVLEGNNFGLTDVGDVASPTFADIDGDGDLDAFVGELTGNTLFFRNSGSATAPSFVAEASNFGLTDVGGAASPTFADIDGDGDLDAFVGESNGNTLFFRNSGSAAAPSFVSEAGSLGLIDVGLYARPTFADIDGDGDLDAFVGNEYGHTPFFRNSGSATAPSFVNEVNFFGLIVGSVARPTFADIDGDGDLDAFVGESNGNTRFFMNSAILLWSSLADGAVVAFDPEGSTLRFDSAAIAAGGISVTPGSVILSHGGKTVTLLTDLETITTANVTFEDGSLLIVGDNTTATLQDDDANALAGGPGNDNLIGLGGNDTLGGGVGNDMLDGGAGADSLNGGADFDFARYGSAVAGLTASLTTPGSNTGDAAGDTYTSIEGLIGTNFGDTLVGDGGVNELQGLAGNDSLHGFGGNDTLRGGNNDDSLTGGSGADTHDGGAGFDYARYDSAATGVTVDLSGAVAGTGDAAGDTFTGMEGVIGSAHADTVSGDALANTLQGRDGNDTLSGRAGDDNLQGGNHNDTLDGGDNNDLLFGQAGSDVMGGGAGDDTLDGGAGADSHDGGSGFDFARYSAAAVGITASLTSPGTNTGEAAGDTYVSIEGLIGTNFGDTLVGNGVANEVQGLFGNDSLYGFADNDTLRGGNDNDSLTGGTGADTLDGGAGFDYARYDSAATGVTVDLSAVLAGTGDAAGDTFVSVEGLVGSAFFDHLYGDGIANILQGRNGTDILEGGAGNDNLQGGNGNDMVLGGTGRDSLYGEAGVDILAGGDDNDGLYGGADADALDGGAGFDYARYDTAAAGVTVDLSGVVSATGDAAGDAFLSIEAIVGTPFADAIYGDGLANTLQGRNGNDTLEGRAGNDSLRGGLDNDILRGDAGNDSLYGEAGIDTLEGGADNDGLYGGAGADVLNGGAGFDYARYDTAAAGVTVDLSLLVAGTGDALGDTFIAIEGVVGSGHGDTIRGDALNNTLQGRNGNDTLDGRLGIDTLIGGSGNDTFRFVLGEANDDTVSDFAGNGAGAGDTLVFQGYGPGATFTNLTATDWRINYTGGSEVIHLANAAPVHASDYSFV